MQGHETEAAHTLSRGTVVNCIEVRNGDLMERYQRGELSEEDAQRLEEHYFSCDDCYELLQDLAVARTELAEGRWQVAESLERTGWRGGWAWALAAALALMAVGVVVWLNRSAPSEARWTELATVEPAPYQPLGLRGPDQGAEAFEEAMGAYQRGDFRAAAEGLAAVAEAMPDDAVASFYLGVSYLLSERPREAIDSLGRVIAKGESRYLDSALYYRAKALLRTGDLAAAREDLATLVSRDGEWAHEAREILDQL